MSTDSIDAIKEALDVTSQGVFESTQLGHQLLFQLSKWESEVQRQNQLLHFQDEQIRVLRTELGETAASLQHSREDAKHWHKVSSSAKADLEKQSSIIQELNDTISGLNAHVDESRKQLEIERRKNNMLDEKIFVLNEKDRRSKVIMNEYISNSQAKLKQVKMRLNATKSECRDMLSQYKLQFQRDSGALIGYLQQQQHTVQSQYLSEIIALKGAIRSMESNQSSDFGQWQSELKELAAAKNEAEGRAAMLQKEVDSVRSALGLQLAAVAAAEQSQGKEQKGRVELEQQLALANRRLMETEESEAQLRKQLQELQKGSTDTSLQYDSRLRELSGEVTRLSHDLKTARESAHVTDLVVNEMETLRHRVRELEAMNESMAVSREECERLTSQTMGLVDSLRQEESKVTQLKALLVDEQEFSRRKQKHTEALSMTLEEQAKLVDSLREQLRVAEETAELEATRNMNMKLRAAGETDEYRLKLREMEALVDKYKDEKIDAEARCTQYRRQVDDSELEIKSLQVQKASDAQRYSEYISHLESKALEQTNESSKQLQSLQDFIKQQHETFAEREERFVEQLRAKLETEREIRNADLAHLEQQKIVNQHLRHEIADLTNKLAERWDEEKQLAVQRRLSALELAEIERSDMQHKYEVLQEHLQASEKDFQQRRAKAEEEIARSRAALQRERDECKAEVEKWSAKMREVQQQLATEMTMAKDREVHWESLLRSTAAEKANLEEKVIQLKKQKASEIQGMQELMGQVEERERKRVDDYRIQIEQLQTKLVQQVTQFAQHEDTLRDQYRVKLDFEDRGREGDRTQLHLLKVQNNALKGEKEGIKQQLRRSWDFDKQQQITAKLSDLERGVHFTDALQTQASSASFQRDLLERELHRERKRNKELTTQVDDFKNTLEGISDTTRSDTKRSNFVAAFSVKDEEGCGDFNVGDIVSFKEDEMRSKMGVGTVLSKSDTHIFVSFPSTNSSRVSERASESVAAALTSEKLKAHPFTREYISPFSTLRSTIYSSPKGYQSPSSVTSPSISIVSPGLELSPFTTTK